MADETLILYRIHQAAAEELRPKIHDDLQRVAAAKLIIEKPGTTRRATVLVHETT
jgi:hypothetical protein